MNSQTLPLWIFCLAFFPGLTTGFSSPEAKSAQTTTANATAATAATAASPSPSPTPNPDDEEEQEIRRNHRFLGDPATAGVAPQARVFVGQEIPVATQYAPPRITSQADGSYVVQPATPTAFETRRTGTVIDDTGFSDTQLEGFIDYGSPIRTVVPITNEKGEVIGTAIQEHPSPILQPVFRTIRKE